MTAATTVNGIILIGLTFSAVIVLLSKVLPHGRHRTNIRKAWRVYDRLNDIASGKAPDAPRTWFFSYLRQIDPFVFEELTLISLREDGYNIRRNRRYTGDGGIDGRAGKNGRFYLVQCKRYSGYIQKRDVEELDELCRRKKCNGLFVHTGKTGEGSREAASQRVEIISGDRLYDLIINKKTKKR